MNDYINDLKDEVMAGLKERIKIQEQTISIQKETIKKLQKYVEELENETIFKKS